MLPAQPVKVFISYAHADQDFYEQLDEHLSLLKYAGKVMTWQDQEILAGANWEDQIATHLHSADIILLLVSPSFTASAYCWDKEVPVALERHRAGTACVIPVILRRVAWQNTPLGQLQALPRGTRPVTEWKDCDAAFDNIVQGIQRVVENILSQAQKAQREPMPGIPLPPSSQVRSLYRWLFIGIILILLVSNAFSGVIAYSNFQQVQHIDATATSQIASTYPFSQTLEMDDPLSHNYTSSNYTWADHQYPGGNNCFFSDNAYHATQDMLTHYHACPAEKTDFSNFTFQVHMTITAGSNDAYGGLIFRATSQSAQFYALYIDSQGNYDLATSFGFKPGEDLAQGSTLPFFIPGFDQQNVIGIVVIGSKISFYVNQNHIKDVHDRNNTYSNGEIGLIAGSESSATDVAYRDAKVWQLSPQGIN